MIDQQQAEKTQHHVVETVKTRIRPNTQFHSTEVDASGALLEVLLAGAAGAGEKVLPREGAPLDRLHGVDKHGEVGAALSLDDGLAEYLARPHVTKDFELELVLAIRVNARWAEATSEDMTPRQILKLPAIELDPSHYSLYRHGSTELLQPDVALKLHRGERFEAQRDGKYGS